MALAALAAQVVAHVFDDPEDIDLDLGKHGDAPLHILQRHALRSGHDQGAGQGYGLAQGKRHIARAGRQINQQIVECPPLYLVQKLLQRPRQERPPPDHRRVLAGDETNRHEAYPGLVHRAHRALGLGCGLLPNTHHQGNARAVDVRVEKADARPLRRQTHGQVDTYSRFSHAPLSAGNGDGMAHLD